jgi:hypothetical protein
VVPVLHLHVVDEADIHIPNAQGRATGSAPLPFDVAFSTGKTGTVHFDLGVTGGPVLLLVEIVTSDNIKANVLISDATDPIFRADIQYIWKIPGAKGSQAAEARAKLEASVAEYKTEIVVGGFLGLLATAWLLSRRQKELERKRQEMLMMMAMSRAPPEVASTHIANGTRAAKKAALVAARPMKMLKAKFRKVSR